MKYPGYERVSFCFFGLVFSFFVTFVITSFMVSDFGNAYLKEAFFLDTREHMRRKNYKEL